MPTPHPTGPASVSALVFPLLAGQIFHLVFSNKTKHDSLCLDVREKLIAVGLNVWQQQKNIPKDSDNWFNEWLRGEVSRDALHPVRGPRF